MGWQRWCLPALLLCAAAAAQDAPAQDEGEQLRRDMDEKVLEIERRVYNQNEIGLKRLEQVEQRIQKQAQLLEAARSSFKEAIAE